MSSHHVVREKQEPALLVLGLDNFPDELLGQLLEWSPTVIATPETAEKLIARGIKIDWLIAADVTDIWQSDVKLMSPGDRPPADAALKFLADNEYPAVNIITDELKLPAYEPFAGRMSLVIFHRNKKIYAVSPGFSKWKPLGEVIEVLSTVKKLSTTGLEKIGDNHYKTAADGFFTLQFSEPFLFIAEDAP